MGRQIGSDVGAEGTEVCAATDDKQASVCLVDCPGVKPERDTVIR